MDKRQKKVQYAGMRYDSVAHERVYLTVQPDGEIVPRNF